MNSWRCLFRHQWRAIHVQHYLRKRVDSKGNVLLNMDGTAVTFRCACCDTLRTEQLDSAGHIPLEAFHNTALDVDAETERALRKMKELK